MNKEQLKKLQHDQDFPSIFWTFIEIMEGSKIKHELDERTGFLSVDRILLPSMVYPCNYGFIPNTIGGDEDPIDVLLIASQALYPNTLIKSRAIGALLTEDEKGEDVKIIALADKKVDLEYQHIENYLSLGAALLKIEHFFSHYKGLEKGKWVKIKGFADEFEAKKIILSSYKS